MSPAVSIVLPALGDTDLLARCLPPLLRELEARGAGDEALIVDDTGDDVLAAWVTPRFPAVRVVPREVNGGFARAMHTGAEAARNALLFSMNTDVVVQPGFLGPLVDCMEDPKTFAVTPKVLLNGDADLVESVTALRAADGFFEFHQPALGEGSGPGPAEVASIAFAVGGTCMLRRDAFLARGGFDPMYEPFYWEDIDLCWSAWRRGERVLYQPASVVEHHHRGTIGKLVDLPTVLSAMEKNRLLFHWKHLDTPGRIDDHVAALYRQVIDAWLTDQREDLVSLNLALEQVEEALAARRAVQERGEVVVDFDRILDETSGV